MIVHRSIFIPIVLIAAAFTLVRPTHRDDSHGSFVTTLGRDTVTLEGFTRTATRLNGDIVVRVPGTVLIHYVVDLSRDGAPTHSVVNVKPMGTKAVTARRVTIDFTRDSTIVGIDSSGHQRRKAVARGGAAFPQLMTGFGASYGLYASPVMYELYHPLARASAGDTVHLNTVDLASGSIEKRVFIKRSATELDADFFGIAWTRFTLDDSGAVTSADASETTEKTQMRRAGPIDVQAAASRFADADRTGKGLGAASPNEIVRGSVGGKLVVATFGSPRRRNRVILGGVVPYGQVWRTGANEASTLVFDQALDIGGRRIPAGAYSLWTVPKSDGSVELIINAQHGQWGTDYDASRDVVHIPMKVTTEVRPQENFAMTIAGAGPSELRMSWDTFVWSVPIALAK